MQKLHSLTCKWKQTTLLQRVFPSVIAGAVVGRRVCIPQRVATKISSYKLETITDMIMANS